jgi:hypothetical protein
MNIRNLKKDIAFLANDIAMSIVINNSIKGTDGEKAAELFVKTSAYKSDFLKKANAFVAKADRKSYYRQLRKDLFEQYSALAEETSKL